MKKTILFILILLLSSSAESQTVRVMKIIDTNLFELPDSSRIKLAGIDMPRLNNPDYLLRKTAKDASLYAENRLLNRRFKIELVEETKEYKLVLLLEDVPLGRRVVNKYFLEEGFGRFYSNIDSSEDAVDFLKMEERAKEKERGIWKSRNITQFGTLDREFSESEKQDLVLTDSLMYSLMTIPKPDAGHFASEVILSPVIGIFAAIPVGVVTGGLYWLASGANTKSGSSKDPLFIAGIGMSLGYIAGNSFAVYYFADKTSRKATYPNILWANLIGLGIGLGVASLNDDHTSGGRIAGLNFAPLLFPALSSAIYATWIAPDKYPVETFSQTNQCNIKNYTAADFYNQSKLFDINLLRINF